MYSQGKRLVEQPTHQVIKVVGFPVHLAEVDFFVRLELSTFHFSDMHPPQHHAADVQREIARVD